MNARASTQLALDLTPAADPFDLAIPPVLASDAFAELCRSLSREANIADAVTMRAQQLRHSWDPSISPTAWVHALARTIVFERRAARREFERVALPQRENLFGKAMTLTRNRADADDLVQDTLVRAWRFWASFQPGSSIKAWLFTILRNTFINGYHRRGRQRDFASDVAAQVCSLGPSAAVANSQARPPSPDDEVGADVTQQRVIEAMAMLPPDYRLAVMLADIEDRSYKEIAEIMECPIGTVMSRIYRGRKALYRMLFDVGVEMDLVSEDDDMERPARARRHA